MPSATIGSKNPVKLARSVWKLWTGLRAARRLIARLKPRAVVGFGGYPTVPPLLAATGMGIPSIIHEQNAVMGRANKMLASRVKAVAGGFLPEGTGAFAAKTVATGNPVRPAVLKAAGVPYAPAAGDAPFHLVVFGGSQGAQFFSKAVPQAVCRLDDALRQRLKVTQQARPEDREGVIAVYEKLGVPAEVSPSSPTWPVGSLRRSSLSAARALPPFRKSRSSGARRSWCHIPTLSTTTRQPMPPHSPRKGARVIAQVELSAERLAGILADAMSNPDALAQMAAGARQTGKPDAARLLALLVEAIASGSTVAKFKETRS